MSISTIASAATEFIENVWNAPDGIARLSDWLTVDYKDHAYANHRDGLARAIAELRAAFSNARFVIEDMIVDEASAALRLKLVGEQTGAFRGRPARGASIEIVVFRWLRFEGRRIAEHWALLDTTSLLKQLDS